MKKESTKALKEALLWLQRIVTPDNCVTNAIAEIRKAVALETPLTTGKFDIYKWCDDDVFRPVMSGVYYDNGKMVASDGRILCVLAGMEYPQEYEGRIRKQDGTFIDGRYPKYEAVKTTNCNHTARVNFDAVREALRSIKAIRKTENRKAQGVCKIGGAWFDVDLFNRFITFLEYKGIDTIKTNNKDGYSRAWVAETEQGDWALVMPLYQGGGEDESDRYFYDCNVTE